MRLFAGLEKQANRTRQPSLIGQFFQNRGGTQQHRRMRIVTTSVHNAGTRAIELSAIDLGNGQGVHVGAQPHGWPGPATDMADHARLGDFGLAVNAQVDQRGVDQTGGALLGKG